MARVAGFRERGSVLLRPQRCALRAVSGGSASRLLVAIAWRPRATKSPISYASTTARTRSRRLSFWSMCVMCVLTVVADLYGDLYDSGALLAGPDATLAGPTFEEWLRRDS